MERNPKIFAVIAMDSRCTYKQRLVYGRTAKDAMDRFDVIRPFGDDYEATEAYVSKEADPSGVLR